MINNPSEHKLTNLYLIGFMGTGKSSVGKVVAEKLGLRFIDSDLEIEKETNLSVSQIFSSLGEAKFRDLEMNFINQGHPSSDCLISCGGGLPVQSGMMNILKIRGMFFVYRQPPRQFTKEQKIIQTVRFYNLLTLWQKSKNSFWKEKKSTLKPIISYHPNREVFRRWLKLLFKNIAKQTTSIAKVLLGNFQETIRWTNHFTLTRNKRMLSGTGCE